MSSIDTKILLQFIREHRSSEAHFEAIRTRCLEASGTMPENEALREAEEKEATAYAQAKTTGGTAWPEYERYIAAVERALLHPDGQQL